MSMQKITQIIVFLFFSATLFAQNKNEIPDYFNPDEIKNSINDSIFFNNQQKKKINFGIEMGTTVASINGQAMFSTYISPYVEFPVSDKFSIEIGTCIGRGNLLTSYNPYFGESLFPLEQNLFQTSFYARGRYKVNNNLSIYGTGQIQRNIFLSQTEGNESKSFDSHSMSLGMEYKLGTNSSIRFEFHTNNYNNPYLRNGSKMFPSSNLMPIRQ